MNYRRRGIGSPAITTNKHSEIAVPMKNQYISAELTHLVGRPHPNDHEANYQILLKVLVEKCVSHPPHDGRFKVSYTLNPQGSLASGDLIVPDVTCFCDIPINRLGLHTTKYGKFGLSFGREILVDYGARPVIYVPYRRSNWGAIDGLGLLNDLDAVHRGFVRQLVKPAKDAFPGKRSLGVEPETPAAAVAAVKSVLERNFLAFIKPFDSDLPEENVANYYLEREWRKFGNLSFKYGDVRHVFVAPGFEARLSRDSPSWKEKVMSLDL